MKYLFDTNVVRAMSCGEVPKFSKEGPEEIWQIAPYVVVELLTGNDMANISIKRDAARLILDQSLEILPTPSTYFLCITGKAGVEVWQEESNYLKQELRRFVDGAFDGFNMPDSVPFEKYRERIQDLYVKDLETRRVEFSGIATPQTKIAAELKEKSLKRFIVKWRSLIGTLEKMGLVESGESDSQLIDIGILDRAAHLLEVYLDIMSERSFSHISTTGKVDPNDAFDFLQFFYVGPGVRLVTGERKWAKIADDCGHGDRVCLIDRERNNSISHGQVGKTD